MGRDCDIIFLPPGDETGKDVGKYGGNSNNDSEKIDEEPCEMMAHRTDRRTQEYGDFDLQCRCPVMRRIMAEDVENQPDSPKNSIGDWRERRFRLNDWIDSQDVLTTFNISVKTLFEMRKDGRIAYSRFGNKIMYCLGDIREMLAENYVERRKDGNDTKTDGNNG